MLQPNTLESPGASAMLAVCVLGVGFMVRFFIALVGDEHKAQAVHMVGTGEEGYSAKATYQSLRPLRHRRAVAEPGTHIALGVLRITSALASDPGREEGRTLANRSHIMTFAAVPKREADSANERLYRLG